MPLAKSISVVVNPWSRGGRGEADWERKVAPALRAKFPGQLSEFVPQKSLEAAVARRLLEECLEFELKRGIRKFIVCGGDGTLNLVLNTITRAALDLSIPTGELKLGAVGMGSSNDFHKSLAGSSPRIAGRFPGRIEFSKAQIHDLPFFEDKNGNPVFFLINLSAGLTAYANHTFNNPVRMLGFLKRTSTDLAIAGAALSTAVRYRNVPMKISWNGRHVACDVVNLSFIKKNHFAGSFYYKDAPARDDGRLGFYAYSNMGRVRTLGQMARLTHGDFRLGPGRYKDFVSEASLESDRSFMIEADGEVHEVQKTKIGVIPKGIGLCP